MSTFDLPFDVFLDYLFILKVILGILKSVQKTKYFMELWKLGLQLAGFEHFINFLV